MLISWYVVGPTCNTPGHADKFNPSQVWLKLAYCGSGEEDFKTILFQLSTLCKETKLKALPTGELKMKRNTINKQVLDLLSILGNKIKEEL